MEMNDHCDGGQNGNKLNYSSSRTEANNAFFQNLKTWQIKFIIIVRTSNKMLKTNKWHRKNVFLNYYFWKYVIFLGQMSKIQYWGCIFHILYSDFYADKVASK